jgi:hypothetical protein
LAQRRGLILAADEQVATLVQAHGATRHARLVCAGAHEFPAELRQLHTDRGRELLPNRAGRQAGRGGLVGWVSFDDRDAVARAGHRRKKAGSRRTDAAAADDDGVLAHFSACQESASTALAMRLAASSSLESPAAYDTRKYDECRNPVPDTTATCASSSR